MAKVFHPGDVISVKTKINPAKVSKPAATIGFLARRVAREQRRARRAL
ncbi:MAG: hypothetical protein JKY25_11685 [Robiginitomaculum sp.]|nr:hypothetical protein [Robiginitomaculum sp.]